MERKCSCLEVDDGWEVTEDCARHAVYTSLGELAWWMWPEYESDPPDTRTIDPDTGAFDTVEWQAVCDRTMDRIYLIPPDATIHNVRVDIDEPVEVGSSLPNVGRWNLVIDAGVSIGESGKIVSVVYLPDNQPPPYIWLADRPDWKEANDGPQAQHLP